MIDNAGCLEDLRVPPANRLEKLDGDRKGQYSIRINDQSWESGRTTPTPTAKKLLFLIQEDHRLAQRLMEA